MAVSKPIKQQLNLNKLSTSLLAHLFIILRICLFDKCKWDFSSECSDIIGEQKAITKYYLSNNS